VIVKVGDVDVVVDDDRVDISDINEDVKNDISRYVITGRVVASLLWIYVLSTCSSI